MEKDFHGEGRIRFFLFWKKIPFGDFLFEKKKRNRFATGLCPSDAVLQQTVKRIGRISRDAGSGQCLYK